MKKLLLLVAAFSACLVFAGGSVSAVGTYSVPATLASTPLQLGQGDVGAVSVNFGQKFEVVNEVCFDLVLSSDNGLDFPDFSSHDELWVQFGKGRTASLLYVDGEGTQGRACTQRASQVSRFNDGTEKFGLFMERGSAVVESVTVTLTSN